MFSSKLCALLSVIVHLAVSQNLPPQAVEEWNNIISPYVSECMPQQETAKEDVEAIIKKAHVKDCSHTCEYLHCLYKKLNLLGPNGEIMEDVVVEKFSYMTKNITRTCAEEAALETDECRKAYAFGKCAVNSFVY